MTGSRARMPLRVAFVLACVSALAAAVAVSAPARTVATASVSLAATGTPRTGAFSPSGSGDATTVEFAGETDEEEGPDPFAGTIDRSHTSGNGHGPSANGSQRAKSNPTFETGFEGLNLYQQRY